LQSLHSLNAKYIGLPASQVNMTYQYALHCDIVFLKSWQLIASHPLFTVMVNMDVNRTKVQFLEINLLKLKMNENLYWTYCCALR